MKSFHRVTTKHKSYYRHAEGISQNGCNSTSRHDFLLKFSVNTQKKILFADFLPFQKKIGGGGGGVIFIPTPSPPPPPFRIGLRETKAVIMILSGR